MVPAAQLTSLREWHSRLNDGQQRTTHDKTVAHAVCGRRRPARSQTMCHVHRRDMLATGGAALGSILCIPQQGWTAAEALDDQQQGSDGNILPDYTKAGPFVPMRLPKLEHTASSAFPACLGNQCLLRVTALYPKAAGSGAKPPYPVAIFSGGFLVPAAKYLSYAERLASWGYVVLLYDKVESAGVEMTFLSDVVSVALVRDLITWTTTDAILSQLTSPELGVYLCGHSRGGKVSVLTAALDERVTALCLLDPVDNTKYAPLSVDFPSAVHALRQLRMQDQPRRPAVPMAVIGGSLSADCAPRDANYHMFYDACAAPAWQAVVPSAGHFQFLDEQSTLDRAVCAAGRTSDATVRAFSQAAMVAWAEIMVRRGADATSRQQQLQEADRQLQALVPGIECSMKNMLVV